MALDVRHADGCLEFGLGVLEATGVGTDPGTGVADGKIKGVTGALQDIDYSVVRGRSQPATWY